MTLWRDGGQSHRMLATLGVLAVLLPARLPRTPITQHPPGAGSGEQALQEALTTYRQLAQTQPQTYLPKVAMTLHNLGIVRLDQEDVPQAHTLMTEALTIRRALWQHHAEAERNDLGPSLAVEIMLPQRREEAVTLICERLHKMAQGTRGEHPKQWAKERAVKVCKSGR
jgi:hypothetical protein